MVNERGDIYKHPPPDKVSIPGTNLRTYWGQRAQIKEDAMILGCLITILAFVFTLVILAFTGVAITFGLLARILIPFVLIAIGISIINKNRNRFWCGKKQRN